ncbi:hypothetical protein IJ579_03810 [bacterium]|nr:hypothetical protein [bacterium]
MVSRSGVRKKKKKGFEWTRKKVLSLLFGALLIFYVFPKISSSVSSIQYKNQYFKVYREFSQAVALLQYKEEDFISSAKGSPEYFIEEFSSLFATDSLCKTEAPHCLTEGRLAYSTLDGRYYPEFLNKPNVGQFVLLDDVLVIVNLIDDNLWITVDINGIKKRPNRLGLDVFTFFLGGDELNLRLMGSSGTPYMNLGKYCSLFESNEYNGLPCAYKAILDREYFNDIKKYLK